MLSPLLASFALPAHAQDTAVQVDGDGDTPDDGDCDDTEACDGQDSEGLVDDDDPDVTGQSTWDADEDADSSGDAGASTAACDAPASGVADDKDGGCGCSTRSAPEGGGPLLGLLLRRRCR
jgi:hypothetical protein